MLPINVIMFKCIQDFLQKLKNKVNPIDIFNIEIL